MIKFLEKQFPSYFIWAPFIVGFGIALYFTLPSEPVIKFPFIVAGLFAANFILLFTRRFKINLAIFTAAAAVCLFSFGFFYAAGFTRQIDVNTIPADIRSGVISGTVASVDYLPDKSRIVIKNATLSSDYAKGKIYDKTTVRLTVMPDIEIPSIGAEISAKGGLFRPGPADIPGGFDFAEWAFFNGFGATGYISEITDIKNVKSIGGVSKLRDAIHRRVSQNQNFHANMLADSLILGYNRAVPLDEYESAKRAGIAHIFSISGYHMTMIGGWMFAFFYLLMRLITPLARRVSVGKIAIIPAALSLCFYLLLSGAGTATMRAFIMALIAFLAMAFNRNVFSLRSAAIGFLIIILINPHYLMQAGFQLSFAAIFGIIYFFSRKKYYAKTKLEKIWNGIKGIFMSTIIATIFTAPFIMYHFHSLQLYGILGNLLCVPIFSILIMPLVLIGTISAMFGIYTPLNWSAYLYEFVLKITNFIAEIPGAEITVPYIPGVAFGIMTLALICVIVIAGRKAKYITASVLVFTSLAFTLMRSRPVFYASLDHELVAYMTDSGELQFNRRSSSNHKFTFESWDAFNERPAQNPRKQLRYGFSGIDYNVKCSGGLCIYRTPEWSLAHSTKLVSFARNYKSVCAENNFIVSVLRIRAKNCDAQILSGGFVIYKNGKIEYVNSNRIWHQ